MDTDIRYNNTEYLVDKYLNDVYRMAMVYVKDVDDAHDISQQVFLTYIQKQPHFNDEDHAKNWLMRVAVNLSKNHLRKNRDLISFDELEGVLTHTDTEYSGTSESDEAVFRAVMKLKSSYREVIHLYYYEGYDTAEIAKIIGVPASSVRSRLARARTAREKNLKG